MTKMKIWVFDQSADQNSRSPAPPFAPSFPDLKNTTSQLSLEKKMGQKSFFDQFLDCFTIRTKITPQVTTVVSQRVMLFSFKDLSLSQKVHRSTDGEIEIGIKFDLKNIFA